MTDDATLIPDERLRFIFVCCHPAVSIECRATLTLRLVCGLARAFLVSEATLAQRLVRAKQKIADVGVPFEVPGPETWPERLDAVLSTLEVAYAKAHEDAAGAGSHAAFAPDMIGLTRVLAELLPREPEALAFAALVRFAEARRPARVDSDGAMVPLSEQNPALWRRPLIVAAESFFERAIATGVSTPRTVQAALHRAWCARERVDDPPPWPTILRLYDRLLLFGDNIVVRLNRVVALAEVDGVGAAIGELAMLDHLALDDFPPYQALRADLFRRGGWIAQARAAYDAALALGPASAERKWLLGRRAGLEQS